MKPHMNAISLRAGASLVSLFLLAATASAQAPDSSGPSVSLTVTPTDIPTNGRVTLKGLGFPENNGQVKLTITPPSGAAAVLVTTPDANGRYSIMFGGTQTEGTYKVSAQVGAQGVPATGTFTVKTYLIDIDEDVADNKEQLHQDSALVATLKKAVDKIPESPAKTDMGAKLDALEKISDQAPAQSAQLAKSLQNFKQVVSSHPETLPFVMPVFDHLAELSAAEEKTSAQIRAEIEGSQKAGADCDQIDHMTQSLKAVPEAFSQALEPFDFLLGFTKTYATANLPASAAPGVSAAVKAVDLAHSLKEAQGEEDAAKAWDKIKEASSNSLAKNEIETGAETEYGEKLASLVPPSLKSNPGYALAVSEIRKFAPQIISGNTEPTKLFTMGAKLAGDALSFGSDQLFSKYCQKFTGDFTATMTAHFFAKSNGPDGMPVEWWSFSTAIKGKLTLRYPKAAAGNAVQLTGQFEGGATKFTYKEDIFNSVLFGRMVKGGVVHKADVPPLVTDNAEGGVINSLESPTSFYVPVTGQLVGNTITVALQPARSDFNDSYTRAHTVYAVAAPTTLGLPVWGHFSLPYMNAHFILDHLVSNSTNTLTVTREGEKLVVDGKRDKTLPGPGNSATYTMDLKACNPDCE